MWEKTLNQLIMVKVNIIYIQFSHYWDLCLKIMVNI